MSRFELVMKYTRSLLAYVIVINTFAFLFVLCFFKVPQGNETILNVAAGFVLAAIGGVCGYYYATSKDKSDADQSVIFPKEPPNP